MIAQLPLTGCPGCSPWEPITWLCNTASRPPRPGPAER
jgi:hypothetical protein